MTPSRWVRPSQLRAARAMLGLSGDDFSALSGVGSATLGRYEKTDGEMPAATLAVATAMRATAERHGVEFVDVDGKFGVLFDASAPSPEPPPRNRPAAAVVAAGACVAILGMLALAPAPRPAPFVANDGAADWIAKTLPGIYDLSFANLREHQEAMRSAFASDKAWESWVGAMASAGIPETIENNKLIMHARVTGGAIRLHDTADGLGHFLVPVQVEYISSNRSQTQSVQIDLKVAGGGEHPFGFTQVVAEQM